MIILIVEDDKGLAELIKEKVEESGYETAGVNSAKEALEWLSGHTPYMMLLDYSLPDMNAKVFLTQLQKKEQPLPPFIVATGQGDERIAVEMMKLGARDYIIKDSLFLDRIPEFIKRVAREIENENKRTQAEEALQESEAQYRSLVSNIPGIVYRCMNDANWTMLYISQEIDPISDYPASDFINNAVRSYASIIHPDDRDLVDRAVRKGVKEKAVYLMEYRICRADGNIRWVHEQGQGYFDPNGNLLFLDGVILDMTAQKKAEDTLQENEEQFRYVLENVQDAVWSADLSGKYTFLSPVLEHIYGRPLSEMMNNPSFWIEAAHPEDQAVVRASKDALLTNAHIELEYRIIYPDGTVHWISDRKTILRNAHGDPSRIAGIISDITQRKRSEEEKKKLEAQILQSQKMEAIGTLAGGIAHDFNNILAIIIGYTEMAMDGNQRENKKQYLQETLAGAERAKNLVKQILTFSRQEDHEKKPLDIKIILKEAIKFLRSSIPSIIEINQQITAEECTIMADPTQMHQVIMNLCINASYAMKEAGGTLKIELAGIELHDGDLPSHHDLQPGHYVNLTVSDTGHGIDPAIVQRVFDPFFTTKSVDEGTGLGLSVVYGIIKSHGGVINVCSEQGKGAAFNVYLPRISKTEATTTDISKPVIGGKERILFVDDEPALVDAGMRMLFSLGYNTTGVKSSIEALDIFRANPESFNLVITDMTLPKMTGIDLSRELLKIRPDIPIILCSGIREPETEEQAKSLGIEAYLTKPLTKRELAQAIRETLDGDQSGGDL